MRPRRVRRDDRSQRTACEALASLAPSTRVDPALQERMRATSFEGSYTFMLHQDLDFVIPYIMGRGGEPEARVTGPDADRAAPLIERALSGRDWILVLYESVRKFVSSTAQHFVIGGPVTYEIDYLHPQEATSGAPTEFRLELVPPGTLSRHRRRPIQYVPAAFGGPRDKTGLTYVDLDPATLVTFRLEPAEEATVRKMVDFLRAASSLHRAETPLMEQSIRGGNRTASQSISVNAESCSPRSPSPSAGTCGSSSRTTTSRPTTYGASSGSLSSRSGSGT